jgi:biotin transport system permease protein
MIAATFDRPTWAHSVPAAVKFGTLLVVTIVILRLDSPQALGLMLLALAALYLSCGLALARAGLRALRGIAIAAALIALWHLVTGRPDAALVLPLRLILAVLAATFVTLTTRLDEISALVDRLLALVRVPAVPRRRLALAIALTIRFVPVLRDKGAALSDAWRARSPRRPGVRIALPLALIAIDDAERVGEALRARGGA